MKIELPASMLETAHQAVADAFRFIRVFGPPKDQEYVPSFLKQPYGDPEEEERCPLCAQPIFPIHARWEEPASVGEITLRCETGHQVELLLEPMPAVRVWIMAKADAPPCPEQ